MVGPYLHDFFLIFFDRFLVPQSGDFIYLFVTRDHRPIKTHPYKKQ